MRRATASGLRHACGCAIALASVLVPAASAGETIPTAADGQQKEAPETIDMISLVRAWLDTFPEGDFDAFPGEVSPDFVLRLPFMPPGAPTEFVGRDVAQAALAGSAKGRSKLVFHDVVILRTEDPELLLTTARAEAKMANGRTYRNAYVMLTRIRDGVVVEHIEYLNPLAVMESMAD